MLFLWKEARFLHLTKFYEVIIEYYSMSKKRVVNITHREGSRECDMVHNIKEFIPSTVKIRVRQQNSPCLPPLLQPRVCTTTTTTAIKECTKEKPNFKKTHHNTQNERYPPRNTPTKDQKFKKNPPNHTQYRKHKKTFLVPNDFFSKRNFGFTTNVGFQKFVWHL